ncbi:MAG: phosphatase PAP2 family protein [Planctomycetota bacterium]|jgi:undecaprenyl-diphosphatase
MTWLGRHELATLVLVLVAAGGTWLYSEIADLVSAGQSSTFDARVLLLMRSPGDHADPVGPAWVEELGRDFTALGGIAVLALVTMAAAGFLALERKYRALVLIVVAVVGGLVLSTVLKHLFARPRPDLVPHGSAVYTASFPSGHSMMSAITYLTLGALLARVQTRKRLKAYLLCLAIFVTFLVGMSRVYLGVHWPTDVLAGWTVGAVWAIVCWLVVRWLQDRGQVESDRQADPGRAEAST